MILKLLSTVKAVTYETVGGEVFATIRRRGGKRGRATLTGKLRRPPYEQAVHYFDGRIDRSHICGGAK